MTLGPRLWTIFLATVWAIGGAVTWLWIAINFGKPEHQFFVLGVSPGMIQGAVIGPIVGAIASPKAVLIKVAQWYQPRIFLTILAGSFAGAVIGPVAGAIARPLVLLAIAMVLKVVPIDFAGDRFLLQLALLGALDGAVVGGIAGTIVGMAIAPLAVRLGFAAWIKPYGVSIVVKHNARLGAIIGAIVGAIIGAIAEPIVVAIAVALSFGSSWN